MEARAVAKYVRISPRKARLVVDLVRGKPVEEALAILRYVPRRAARVVEKVVQSAAANAEHNLDLNREDLYISEAFVNAGPMLKRWRARARGQAFQIRRRTSHITVVVKEKEVS